MGSLENFHQESCGGCSRVNCSWRWTKAMGGDPNSVAFSKFWTLFPTLPLREVSASYGDWMVRSGGSSSARSSHSSEAR